MQPLQMDSDSFVCIYILNMYIVYIVYIHIKHPHYAERNWLESKTVWVWNFLRHFGHKTNLHPSVNNVKIYIRIWRDIYMYIYKPQFDCLIGITILAIWNFLRYLFIFSHWPELSAIVVVKLIVSLIETSAVYKQMPTYLLFVVGLSVIYLAFM